MNLKDIKFTELFGPRDNGTCQAVGADLLTGRPARCDQPGTKRWFRVIQADGIMSTTLTCAAHSITPEEIEGRNLNVRLVEVD